MFGYKERPWNMKALSINIHEIWPMLMRMQTDKTTGPKKLYSPDLFIKGIKYRRAVERKRLI
jgi:hypothetical protein